MKDPEASDEQWASYAIHHGWSPDASSGSLWDIEVMPVLVVKAFVVKGQTMDACLSHERDGMHSGAKKEEVE